MTSSEEVNRAGVPTGAEHRGPVEGEIGAPEVGDPLLPAGSSPLQGHGGGTDPASLASASAASLLTPALLELASAASPLTPASLEPASAASLLSPASLALASAASLLTPASLALASAASLLTPALLEPASAASLLTPALLALASAASLLILAPLEDHGGSRATTLRGVTMEGVPAWSLQLWRDRERLHDLVVDANDGIVAIAGVVEGVLGAGLGNRAAATAVLMATVAGGIAIGGSRYTETAAEDDALGALLEEERRQLRRSPDQELDELAALYEEKGLAPDLARTVAVELSAADALAAHAEEEHGIEVDEPRPSPLAFAIASGVVFLLGALLVVTTVVLTPSHWRVPTTFVAVSIALGLSSGVISRWGDVPLWRTVARNVAVGLTSMAVSFAVGSLVEA